MRRAASAFQRAFSSRRTTGTVVQRSNEFQSALKSGGKSLHVPSRRLCGQPPNRADRTPKTFAELQDHVVNRDTEGLYKHRDVKNCIPTLAFLDGFVWSQAF